PHPGWTEPRPARRAGRSCLQGFGDGFVPLPAWAERLAERAHLGMEPMGEDCLYLNVFSPDVESTGLPCVLFVSPWCFSTAAATLEVLASCSQGILFTTVTYSVPRVKLWWLP
ncbi:unnamed protein product, partial [Prorocentrum cordatum]